MLSFERRNWLTMTMERYETYLDSAAGPLQARGLLELAPTYHLGVVREPEPQHNRFDGRLAIPYMTPAGCVDIRFRCIEDHDCKAVAEAEKEAEVPQPLRHRKYLQDGEDHVFNVGALHERNKGIAVCEGELDTCVADTYVLPSVGISGATKWKPHWSRLFEDYERVFVIGDGDAAGREFAKVVSRKIGGHAVRIVMPDDHDINSYFVEHGDRELYKIILGESE